MSQQKVWAPKGSANRANDIVVEGSANQYPNHQQQVSQALAKTFSKDDPRYVENAKHDENYFDFKAIPKEERKTFYRFVLEKV